MLSLFSEEFNRKILVPELDQKNLGELHMELKNLFIMYIDPKAIDTIQFDNEIVDSLREGKAICIRPVSFLHHCDISSVLLSRSKINVSNRFNCLYNNFLSFACSV